MSPRLFRAGLVQALEDWKHDLEAGPPGLAQYGSPKRARPSSAARRAMITDWGDIGTLVLHQGLAGQGQDRHDPDPGASKVYDRTAKAWIKPEGGANHAPYLASRPGCSAFRPRPRTRRPPGILRRSSATPRPRPSFVAYPDSGIQPSRTKTIEDPQPLIDAGMDPADAKQYLEGIGKAVGHPNAVLDLSIPGSGEYYNFARRRGVALHGRRDQRRTGHEERRRRLEPDHRPTPRQSIQAL